MASTYLPDHDSQFQPRTAFSGRNCNMAAAADAARFWSLGLINHNHQWYRDHAQNPDGSADRSGGTTIAQAAEVLDDAGVPSNHYDALDGKGLLDVRVALRTGKGIIAHGDVGSIPRGDRGEIDPDFTGLHSVWIPPRFNATGVLVGDGLSTSYEWWSWDALNRYLRDFPGGGYTYLTVTPRRLRAKGTVANVRPSASKLNAPIGTISRTSRIHVGGVVLGQYIGSNRRWFRVFYKGQIGYVHTSVAEIV